MNCIKCLVEMKCVIIGSVELNECPACGGVWFDSEELHTVKDQRNPDLNWMDLKVPEPDREAFPEACFDWLVMDYIDMPDSKSFRKSLLCPKCVMPILPLIYNGSSVQIDFCTKCEGIWLDRGEFEKILAELEFRMHSMSLKECICASLRQAKEIFVGREMVLSEWRDFSTVIRILHCKVLCEREAIAKALDAIRWASVSLS